MRIQLFVAPMACLSILLASGAGAGTPAPGPEPGAGMPSKEAALALAEQWRKAIAAESCERSKKDFIVRCSGDLLKTAMPPPLWFGIDINDKEYVGDECEKWGNAHRVAKVEAGPDYDLLTTCITLKMDARKSEPVSVVAFGDVAKRLPERARKQLQVLDKTHRFALINHKPTSPDPDRFDLIFAITNDSSGKPRIAAMFVRLVVQIPDGE